MGHIKLNTAGNDIKEMLNAKRSPLGVAKAIYDQHKETGAISSHEIIYILNDTPIEELIWLAYSNIQNNLQDSSIQTMFAIGLDPDEILNNQKES